MVRGMRITKSVVRWRRSRMMLSLLIVVITTVSTILNIPALQGQESGTKAHGIRSLYLIRHGQYDCEDDRDPDIGRALIPLGIAQARLVASRLRSLPVEMTSLHSSTMTRARQTALVVGEEFPALQLHQSRLLRECTPPTWREDIMAQSDSTEMRKCVDQLELAFSKYFVPSPDDDDRHDIIVCHGNVIRYFVTKVLGVDSLSWLRMYIGNCSLTEVRIKPDGSMRLVSYGDVGHLPPNLQTGGGRDGRVQALVLPGEE